jgi:hypothetical protein
MDTSWSSRTLEVWLLHRLANSVAAGMFVSFSTDLFTASNSLSRRPA